jgi:hypothetical protein
MTETQKLIATEIVKQRIKRGNSLALFNKGWPGFLENDLKRDIEQTHAIEEVLARLFKNVAYAKSLGAV